MIRMFFGSPGCGKTTSAVRFIRKEQKAQAKYEKWQRKRFKSPLKMFRMFIKNPKFYEHYYTNFSTGLSTEVSLCDLGHWTLPQHCHLTVDESGIEYNNRKFKSLDQLTIQWLKLHRHYRVDVDFYSQSWEDTDVTIRRLAEEYWHIKKLGPFTMLRKVRKFVTVNDQDKQIIDGYEFKSWLRKFLPFPFHEDTWYIFWRRPYYKYFDSYSTPPTPVKYRFKVAASPERSPQNKQDKA